MLLHVDEPGPDVETTTPTAPPKSLPHRKLPTAAWFGLSLLSFLLAVAVSRLINDPSFIVFLLGGVLLFAIATVIASIRALTGAMEVLDPAGLRPRSRVGAMAFGNLLLAIFGFWGMFVAFMSTLTFSRGRQLRRFGRVLLPDLQKDGAWTGPAMPIESAVNAPAGLADQWRENGKTEHASVAAFARLTLDLMALGAPPHLIAAANQDALDEIRHTELCFGIARALDGKSLGPDRFPQAQQVATLPRARTLALAKLAVDSMIDGALHEGVSARVIGKLARRCEAPVIREALKEIAADEGWHAAHGWEVVRWCVEQGGRPVVGALQGAVRALPKTMDTDLPTGARNGGWEAWGIHGHALEAAEYAAARAQVVERVEALAGRPAQEAA